MTRAFYYLCPPAALKGLKIRQHRIWVPKGAAVGVTWIRFHRPSDKKAFEALAGVVPLLTCLHQTPLPSAAVAMLSYYGVTASDTCLSAIEKVEAAGGGVGVVI